MFFFDAHFEFKLQAEKHVLVTRTATSKREGQRQTGSQVRRELVFRGPAICFLAREVNFTPSPFIFFALGCWGFPRAPFFSSRIFSLISSFWGLSPLHTHTPKKHVRSSKGGRRSRRRVGKDASRAGPAARAGAECTCERGRQPAGAKRPGAVGPRRSTRRAAGIHSAVSRAQCVCGVPDVLAETQIGLQ